MKPDSVIKTGLAVALAVVVLGVFVGVVFRKELSDFLDRTQSEGGRATLRFGRALDPGGRTLIDPTTTFRLGENVAWTVRFEKGAGVKELIVALFEIADDGREIPLDRNKMTVEPTDVGLYNFTTTQAFWSLSHKDMKADRHTYRVKYLKDHVIAQGDFTIVAADREPSSDRPASP